MKKIGIACIASRLLCVGALVLASSTALAQSSIQLYGQIDEWVGSQSLPGGKRAWELSGGGMATSFWGLRGSEALGNDMNAVFSMEGFFRPQNGAAGRFSGDTFFARNAYVGLSSSRYGTLTFGRQTTPLFISTIFLNPFVDSFTFSPMISQTYLGLGTGQPFATDMGAVGDTAWSNSVKYATPDFNGLKGTLMYGLGNQAGQNGAKKWSAQFLYLHGPLAATGVYQYASFSSTPTDLSSLIAGMKSQQISQIGLSYDFSFAKFFGQYMYTKNDQSVGGWHVNTLQGGVSVPIDLGNMLASYAYSRDAGGLNQTRQTASLGYDYWLSKRTDIYVSYLYDHVSQLEAGNTFGIGLRHKF
ncbi:porin [Burkholderia cepacia]